MSSDREFDYRPSWTMLLFCGLFFGACAIVLGAKAINNDRGLIINGIIELEEGGATAFFWALAACSFAFVAIALFSAVLSLVVHQRVVLGTNTIRVPASRWSSREMEIAYDDIQSLSKEEISGQAFFHVIHGAGKFTIMAGMLPSKPVFDEVCELLATRVRESKSAEKDHGEPGAFTSRRR